MKPKVDKDLCVGCGACTSLCAAVFKLGDDGKSEVIEGVDYKAEKVCIQKAVENCPVQAISVE
jgi:ferredoxin